MGGSAKISGGEKKKRMPKGEKTQKKDESMVIVGGKVMQEAGRPGEKKAPKIQNIDARPGGKKK